MARNIFDEMGIAAEPTAKQQAQPKNIFNEIGIKPDDTEPPISIQDSEAVAVKLQEEVEFSAQQWEKLALMRFTPEKIQEFKANPITFSQAFDYTEQEKITPFGGIKTLADAVRVKDIGERYRDGKEISSEELNFFNQYVDRQIEVAMRGYTIGGQISGALVQMPAFAFEFIASGGVGKLAQKAVVKSAEQGAVRAAAGIAANVAARTAAMPQRYMANYGERRVNDFMAITDKGELVFQQSKESPAKSALLAFLYTGTEVASEMSGAAIGKYLVSPVANKLKTPFINGINKLPAELKINLVNAYQKIKPNATVTELLTKTGWHGMLEELGEERIAQILNAHIGLALENDYTFDDYINNLTPTGEQLLVEAGTIGIARGIRTSLDVTANLMEKRGASKAEAKEVASNMTELEREKFIDDNLKVDDSLVPSVEKIDMQQQNLDELDDVPQKQPPEKVLYSQQIDNAKAKINDEQSIANKLYGDWVAELYPIEQAANLAMERGAEFEPGRDPLIAARMFAGVSSRVESQLLYRTDYFDDSGNLVVTGKSLKQTLDDFDNYFVTKEQNIETRFQDFQNYLVATRYLEDLRNRADVEVTEAQIQKSQQQIQQLQDKYGEDFAFMQKFAEDVYEFQRNILQNLVRAGVISKQQYEDITSKNKKYIPFERIFPEEFAAIDGDSATYGIGTSGRFSGASADKAIKKIKGSELDVKDPIPRIIRNTANIMKLAERNNVARSIASMQAYLPDYVQEAKESGDNTITVYQDGKKKFYRVSKPIYEAATSLAPYQLSTLQKLFMLPASVLRMGATLNPEFMARSIVREAHVASILSGAKFRPDNWVRGLFAVIENATGSKNNLYNEYRASGSRFNSYMELNDDGIQKSFEELLLPKNKRGLAEFIKSEESGMRGVLDALEKTGVAVDEITRSGVYDAAKKMGLSDIEAALLTRDVHDYTRRGKIGKNINRYVPFFNAGIQGTDKLIRAFKNNPKAAVTWSIATITIPSLAIASYYLYAAPEDERREYLEFPDYVRNIFWVYKVDGEWKKIPKPFAPGYLFGTVPEKMAIWMYEGDKPEGRELWKTLSIDLLKAASPVYDVTSLIPTAIKVPVEAATNYNFFFGRDIYPNWMDRLEPEKRYTENTTETSKFIGERLGISPAIVENTLRGTIAGSAVYLTDAGDKILGMTKDIVEKPDMVENRPILRAFAQKRPSGYRSESARIFFDNYNQISQIYNTNKTLKGSQLAEHTKRNALSIRLYPAMNNYYDQMRELNKSINEAYESKAMSDSAKVKKIMALEDKIVVIARQANKFYDKANKPKD